MEFAGKRVVLTGAAGIFGGWIAAAFARAGAHLCLSDVRGDELERVAARLGLDPAQTLLHGTELTSAASIEELGGVVERGWGAPDIVVNNAGIYPRTPGLLELDVADWDAIMGVNLRAP